MVFGDFRPHFTSVSNIEMHFQCTIQNQKYFIFIIVNMPGNFITFCPDNFNVLTIQFSYNLGRKRITEHAETFFNIHNF